MRHSWKTLGTPFDPLTPKNSKLTRSTHVLRLPFHPCMHTWGSWTLLSGSTPLPAALPLPLFHS